jgi:hypothetical protein
MSVESIRVKVNGRVWRVVLAPATSMGRDWGRCDHPPGRHPTIQIRRSLKGVNLLDTVVHELLHAALPQLDEETVDTTARSIAKGLHALQYRRQT